jgi:hypothetical protein
MGLTDSEPRGRRLKHEQRQQILDALTELNQSHTHLLSAVADLGSATRELGAAARRLEAFMRGAQPWRMPKEEEPRSLPPEQLP